MRIALVGNIANNYFREGQGLQKIPGVQADLFLVSGEQDLTQLPESDNPSLAGAYPDWIRMCDGFKASRMALLVATIGIRGPLKRLNHELITKLNGYDICFFSTWGVNIIPLINSKSVFRATGADLTVYPIFTYKELAELSADSRGGSVFGVLRSRLQYGLTKRLSRQAIRSADYISMVKLPFFTQAADKLGIPEAKRISNSGLAIDLGIFRKREGAEDTAFSRWGIPRGDFVVSLPSASRIRTSASIDRAGQTKASDKAILGFSRFVSQLTEKERTHVRLIIPDRPIWPDFQKVKELVSKNGLETYTIFAPGNGEQGLDRDQMVDLYSISDVVLDNFGVGWFGSLVLEALACEATVVTHLVDEWAESIYDWHPILTASTEEEISKQLLWVFRNPTLASEQGALGRQWITQNHSQAVVGTQIVALAKGLL